MQTWKKETFQSLFACEILFDSISVDTSVKLPTTISNSYTLYEFGIWNPKKPLKKRNFLRNSKYGFIQCCLKGGSTIIKLHEEFFPQVLVTTIREVTPTWRVCDSDCYMCHAPGVFQPKIPGALYSVKKKDNEIFIPW